MIIVMDANVWGKLAEFFEEKIAANGTVILERHLIDDNILHWVCNLGGNKEEGRILLGRVELNFLSHTTMTSINEKYVKAAGFGSKELLKRVFASHLGYKLARGLNHVTVAQMKVIEVERYWCPKCFSTNLDYLKKNILGNQLPFGCFDCGEEFYTEDKDFGSPRIKNAKLGERYCKARIKKIPVDQQVVLAIVGENWFQI